MSLERRLPLGAEVSGESGKTAVDFRIWAPVSDRVEVVLGDRRRIPSKREPSGHWRAAVDGLGPGARYGYSLDGGEVLADPVSRFQPDGPLGLSEIIDPRAFAWTDAGWRGIARHRHVLYELHVGTFSPAGTFDAVTAELEFLAALGVTTIELLPVNEFGGEFGWGYDGVQWFAPTHLYGRPDDLRRLVDRAHALGMGVILDVVYNHLGAVGNFLPRFGPYTAERAGEWGDALDYDGPDVGAAGARELVTSNAAYWIREYHLDGLRLDATQCIIDRSPDHIVAALARAAREAAGERTIFLVAENEPQDVRHVAPPPDGFGLDALWNDDFHHAARVAGTGQRDGYLQDYGGTPQELISAVTRGFLFQGQLYPWQKNPRGTPTRGVPPAAFVHFLQNHDQCANGVVGGRPDRATSPGRRRALTALLLLTPALPMLFQGQETGTCTPWTFFADHAPPLGDDVRRGRARFMAEFAALATPAAQAALPDPTARTTFEACVLDPSERRLDRTEVRLHRDLLRLRREEPAFTDQRPALEGAVLADEAFALRFVGSADDGSLDRLLLVNLGATLRRAAVPEPRIAPPPGAIWTLVWSSEDVAYGGGGTAEVFDRDGLRLPGHAAVLLAPTPGSLRVETEAGA